MTINTILRILFLVICYSAVAQETKEITFVNTEKDMKGFLTEKRWESNQIFGTDIDSYQLKEFIPRKFAGYLTTFTDTMTFTSLYTAPCGNDEELGRINTGRYKLIGSNKIEIIVEKEILPNGLNMSTEKPNSKKMVFLISKSENELIFTKRKIE